MAADSRSVYQEVPNDRDCKIAVIDRQFVFATSGLVGYVSREGDAVQGWMNVQEAEAAVHSRVARTDQAMNRVQNIANAWAERVRVHYQLLSYWHPDLAAEAVQRGKGGFTSAIFAGPASNGNIDYAIREIRIHNNRPEIAIPVIDCQTAPCAYGSTDVFTEYFHLTSERAREQQSTFSPSLLERVGIETLRAIRLADLTVAYDRTGLVGGPIDAVELLQDGSIHWVQRKPNCHAEFQVP